MHGNTASRSLKLTKRIQSNTDPFTGKVNKKKRIHRGLFIVETPEGRL